MAVLWIISFDWDNDNSYSYDESASVIALSYDRGREDLFSDFLAGKAMITLQDDVRRFDPWFISSALYPNVMPGRRVRIRTREDSGIIDLAVDATDDLGADADTTIIAGTDYTIFEGKIADITPTGHIGTRRVIITAYDGLRDLNAADSQATLQESVSTDEVITTVLDAVDWPAGDTWRDLDIGSTSLAYWWSPGGERAAGLINQIAQTENGAFFISAAGKARFINRINWGTAAATGALDEDNISDLVLNNPWDSVRNVISVRCYPVQLASSADIWQLEDATVSIPAGDNIEIWAEYYDSNKTPVAAKDVITPVATTDYTANTVQGGGGSDMTASMSVAANIYSTWCKLTITNTHGATAFYITLLKIRGKAIATTPTTIRRTSTSSQAIYGNRTLSIEAPWTQDVDSAIDLATALREFYARPRATITVALDNLLPDLLKYELGDRVALTIDSYSIAETMRIGRMTVSTGLTMQDISGTFEFEPADNTVYWLLGDVLYGILGSTTTLGY